MAFWRWEIILGKIAESDALLRSSGPMKNKATVILLNNMSQKKKVFSNGDTPRTKARAAPRKKEKASIGITKDRRTCPKSSTLLGDWPGKRRTLGTRV